MVNQTKERHWIYIVCAILPLLFAVGFVSDGVLMLPFLLMGIVSIRQYYRPHFLGWVICLSAYTYLLWETAVGYIDYLQRLVNPERAVIISDWDEWAILTMILIYFIFIVVMLLRVRPLLKSKRRYQDIYGRLRNVKR